MMHNMTHDGLAPLFRPSQSIGNLWRFLDDGDPSLKAPHYDVARLEEGKYQITLSVPGFAEENLRVETNQNVLTISGNYEDAEKDAPRANAPRANAPRAKEEAPKNDADAPRYLYRSIESRSFTKSFRLGDHIRVVDAKLQKGLLSIDLETDIPEDMKPQQIAISVQ